MTINNLKEFNAYIDLLASEWRFSEQDLHDFCHEQSDGSEHVIYYSNAWDLVNMIRWADRSIFDDAELGLENMSMSDSLDTTMCLLAYEIIYQQLSLAVQELGEA